MNSKSKILFDKITEILTKQNKNGDFLIDIYKINSGCKGMLPLNDGTFVDISKSLQNDLTVYLKVIKT